MAFAAVAFTTPNSWAISSVDGTRLPGEYVPPSMRRMISAAICRHSGRVRCSMDVVWPGGAARTG